MGSRTARLASAFLAFAVFFTAGAGAAEKPDKFVVIASLFPQYDFARIIAGDRADVRLLLPPGAESHSFEPTPSDMRDIASADLFIYTGPHMEPWAKRLADAAATPDGVVVVDASEGVRQIGNDRDENADGENRKGGHDHDPEHDHDADHERTNGAHFHDVDPHIWLSPPLAATMVENIANAFAARDAANADFYRANAGALLDRINQLDAWFLGVVKESPRKLLVFGERFAFTYFFERYGLEMAGAYRNCAPGAEPGLRAVIGVVETVRKNGVQFIYLEDASTGRISELIRTETGAEILRVDSLHNPPLARQRDGDGYVEIMRANMDAFAKGLQ